MADPPETGEREDCGERETAAFAPRSVDAIIGVLGGVNELAPQTSDGWR